MFYTLKIKDKEYKLRLTTRAAVDAERRLGKNPLYVLSDLDQDNLPKIEDMMVILHASMDKFNHGITLDQCYDIYDDYIDDGHSMMEMIQVIMDVFKASGFIQVDNSEKDEAGENPN